LDLTPVAAQGRQLIQGHRPGGFSIAGRRHQGSVLILPDRTTAWPVAKLAEVTVASLEALLEAEPKVEILILGTGPRFALVEPALREELRARGAILEAMDTRAACRTFNVLLAEDRRVGAALIAI
jgi:uncharacterized protein